jgi:hypothetical protein
VPRRHSQIIEFLVVAFLLVTPLVAEADCTIDSFWYWPSTGSAACTGKGGFWAYNLCWKMDVAPEDWSVVCPAGCSWYAKPFAGCFAEQGEQQQRLPAILSIDAACSASYTSLLAILSGTETGTEIMQLQVELAATAPQANFACVCSSTRCKLAWHVSV